MALDQKMAQKIIKVGNDIAAKTLLCVEELSKMTKGKCGLEDMVDLLVTARLLNDTIEGARKEITKQLTNRLEMELIPEKMDDQGITTFTSKSGFRIVVGERFSISIIPEMRAKAYDWLRANNLGDLITETVNAQTLSAQGRKLIQEENKDLPADLFKTNTVPSLSVTAVKTAASKTKGGLKKS